MIEIRRTRAALVVLLLGLMLGPAVRAAAGGDAAENPGSGRPTVQLALLLDTSNSMDGLIDQAKAQLWMIVGEFAETKLAGKMPRLEVALYEYGNDKLPATEGHIRMVAPLTDDLDRISEALFALTTDGGQEYCGKVIQAATRQLGWGKAKGDLRCIFIAGNEEFTQGDVDYQGACRAAVAKGITVSTIFCGDRVEGIQTKWEDGAKLADGSYLCINQDHHRVAINAPQDKELATLSSELNKTYLPYGDPQKRKQFADRQKAQDANAARSAVSAAAARAGFKASGLYRNSGWDLVDAVGDGTVKLESLGEDQLPEVMQPMNRTERRVHLEKIGRERKQLQARIQKLAVARDAYVAKERARLAAESPADAEAAAAPLAEAIEEAIESQVGEK
jgi:hypothetical protein